MLKAIWKNGIIGWVKSQAFEFGLYEISTKCNDNQKTNPRWCWKMNAHAHSSKCFCKNDVLFFLTVVQMEGCKLEQLKVEGHKPT
jgi:hypothetical protein